MKNLTLKIVPGLLCALALAASVRAQSMTNNFTGSADYIHSGIIGDTNWDGVYLNGGDIRGGASAGGRTLGADETSNPGFLTVQSTVGAWVGNEDDSFFLYKVVAGDFDVSVGTVPPFANSAYHLPGVLVRAYNPNNSGSPYSATVTNVVENWIYNSRFQEFGINEHGRYATNGADINGYFDTAGDSSDTNSYRYVRITRVGDIFSFYDKTNPGDAWNPIGTPLVRPDLHGVAMQVGIHDESGTGNTPTTFFQDFELTGTNLNFPALPAAPSAIVTTATNTAGSLTLSWTVGSPGDSSLVVISQGPRPIQHNPVNGMVYTASANNSFGDNSALLDGAGEYVVYNGAGNSVTITNLSANIFNYNVAVFEYTNNGVETVYNTAAPATNNFVGPGVITSTALSVNTTNIPVNGATSFKLFANFSTGLSNVDQTANTIWSSSDSTIAAVNTAGAVSGVAAGSATITATLGTFTNNIGITVHGPFAFSDNFTSTNDYVANGLVNSMYDGLFMNFGDVPGGHTGADGAGFTVALNSQIANTNGLLMSSVQSDWSGSANDGPFLFKIVPGTNQAVSGDFEAVVHINNMNTLNGVVAGIMARLYNPANAGPGPNNQESHVNYWKVQNGNTSVRATQANAATTYLAAGPSAADGWLLIQRENSTNFYFYERANTNATWTQTATVVLATATNNAPMEVGPAQQSTVGVNGIATFDTFAVDAPGMTSVTPEPPEATNLVMSLNTNNLSITLNWVAADNSGNPVASIVVMRAGAPVTAVPPVGASLTGNSVFGSGSNLGANNYVVFVSANPPGSTNNTVTVTGLTQGQTYYAAVFTYAGNDGSTIYNPVTTATGNLIDAAITNIYSFVPGGIPAGGIGKVTIYGVSVFGAQLIPINAAGAVISSQDTNTIQALQGVLTGITNGNAGVQVVLGPFTNNIIVTVRPPAFTDDFTSNQDFLLDGVTNTAWDGLYNPAPSSNPIPGSPYVPLANSGASVALENPVTNVVITATNIIPNVSTNYTYVTNVVNVLTISASGDGWENAASGGFFLFKYVPGDFQMAVNINSFNVSAYNQPGLLARGYAFSNGIAGWPLGYAVLNAGGTNDMGEYWVSLTRFDEFGIGTYARRNLDSAVAQNTQSDQGDGNFWLLIVRSGDGSQFDFYQRATPTNAWRQVPNKTHYSIPQLAGQPMQVGMMAGPWNGASVGKLTVQFDNFMLDSLAPVLNATAAGGNVMVTWPAVGSPTLQQSPSLNPSNWQPVGAVPAIGLNGLNIVTLPSTNSTEFFRLVP